MKDIKLTPLATAFILKDLAEAAQKSSLPACGSLCTVVANLIANAGPWGGSNQKAVMDAAAKHGFQPEFYGDTVRVTWSGEAETVTVFNLITDDESGISATPYGSLESAQKAGRAAIEEYRNNTLLADQVPSYLNQFEAEDSYVQIGERDAIWISAVGLTP